MIKNLLKRYGEYIIAVIIFLSLSIAFFYPIVLENKTLVQYDIKSGRAWGQDAREYHEKTGEYSHWTNNMFSGMPTNYAYAPKSINIFSSIGSIFYLNNAGNFGLLFLYMFGFYILLISLGASGWLSIIGAIAYAFCSYNIVIIDAGHINKGLVMATMAPIIGGIILCYKQKYLWGILITLIFTGLNVAWAHQQISYYLLLTIIILFVVYLIYAIKSDAIKPFLKSSLILIAVALLAITPSLGHLLPTMDYVKESMRGGSVLQKDQTESSGLDLDYAYQWSYGKMETFTLLIPNFAGGSSTYKVDKDSETYKALLPTGQADLYSKSMPMYWADNEFKTFTSGPIYGGAIICFLFILGLIIVKGKEKWWILGATVLSIILSWGRNFYGFNEFLFHNLPLYNKFRTPEMALVIANMTMALLAMLAIKEVISNYKDKKKEYLKAIYWAAGITGGLSLIFALFGGTMFDFVSNADKNFPDWLQSALMEDRKSMLSSDAWRTLIFIILSAGVIFLFINNKLKDKYLLISLGLLIFIDLWTVDRRFIDADKFVPKKSAEEFVASQVDKMIMQDKDPDYRVLNLASNTFNESNTSYFHKSIGGYSPAKLRRYQDIIDFYLGNSQKRTELMNTIVSSNGNLSKTDPNAFPIINMLNTKYFIVPTQGGAMPLVNPHALGNAWFVDNITWVATPDEEIVEIGKINPRHTAVIEDSWKDKFDNNMLSGNQLDSTSYIRLTEYNNPGYLIYESNSNQSTFALFSEVYYKTWKAYIDGKEVPLIRANYILRGVQIPEGKHKIELKCHDDVISNSATYSLIASIVVGIVLLALVGLLIYRKRNNKK